MLDSNKKIEHRLYRDQCIPLSKFYLKNLTILGRKMKNVILLEVTPKSFRTADMLASSNSKISCWLSHSSTMNEIGSWSGWYLFWSTWQPPMTWGQSTRRSCNSTVRKFISSSIRQSRHRVEAPRRIDRKKDRCTSRRTASWRVWWRRTSMRKRLTARSEIEAHQTQLKWLPFSVNTVLLIWICNWQLVVHLESNCSNMYWSFACFSWNEWNSSQLRSN